MYMKITSKIIIFSVFGIVFVSFFVIKNNKLLSNKISRFISEKPERITELYFTNYSSIPKKLKINNVYKINFTTTNRELRNEEYAYRAFMIEDDKEQIISSKRFELLNNQSKNQQIEFMPVKPNSQIKIVIKLLNKKQQIRFNAST